MTHRPGMKCPPLIGATAVALLCATVSTHAQQDAATGPGQAFPVKAITLLIPFPPGTGNDIVGRLIGNKMSENFGQRVVADRVVRAAAVSRQMASAGLAWSEASLRLRR